MERRVRRTGKDQHGNITSLCNPGEPWSPRQKADAIKDIDSGTHRYYVEEVAPRVYVTTPGTPPNKYLRTTADKTSKNNLDNLPDC